MKQKAVLIVNLILCFFLTVAIPLESYAQTDEKKPMEESVLTLEEDDSVMQETEKDTYEVTFEVGEFGSTLEETILQVQEGETIQPPVVNPIAGYVFTHWQNLQGEQVEDNQWVANQDMSFTAVYEKTQDDTEEIQPAVFRGAVDASGTVYVADASDTFETIKAALADPNITELRFSEDLKIDWGTLNLNRTFTVTVDQGVEVKLTAINKHKDTAFSVVLAAAQTFSLQNNGSLTLNNFNRGFWIRGGDETTQVNLIGKSKETSELNILNNKGYAIGLLDHYYGKVLIDNTKLTTNSTEDSAESAIYLGNQYSATVNIKNSLLNLVNKSDQYTSSAFASNAGEINIENTVINSSSMAHYNFNTYNNIKTPTVENSRQKVNFIGGSKLNLNTPTNSNPHRLLLGFPIRQDAVGMNSSNTVFNVTGGSSITHNVEDFQGSHLGLELEGSKLKVTDGSVDFRSVGFDGNIGKSEIIFEDNSKATIDAIKGYNALHLPEIKISGGSVLFKEKVPAGTNIINQFGEELEKFKIPKGNFAGNGTIKVPENPDNSAYKAYDYIVDLNNTHDGTAHIWTPAVTIKFYPSIDDATNDTNQMEKTIKTPRGANILLVGEKSPQNVRGYWKNLENGERYIDETLIPKDTKVYLQETGNVIVKYVDENGIEIQDSVVDTDESDVGTPYDTTDRKPLIIIKDGKKYELVEVRGEEKGSVINDTIIVTYVYKEVESPKVPEDPKDPEDPTVPKDPKEEKPSNPNKPIIDHEVNFDIGDHGTTEDPLSEKVSDGNKVTKVPQIKVKEGYRFVGWKDKNGKFVNPKDVLIYSNQTFYAVYEAVKKQGLPNTGTKSSIVYLLMGFSLCCAGALLLKTKRSKA